MFSTSIAQGNQPAARFSSERILKAMAHHTRMSATGFTSDTLVRDSLYDRIPLARPERALIESTAFGRLERIQQLGFVSKVWPAAHHTRFEHSLGVMHLVRLAVAQIRAQPGGASLTDLDGRAIVAAALLHDIGHYPFSHAIEELGHPVWPHERVGRAIVVGPEVAPILEEQWGIDPERVARFIDPGKTEMSNTDQLLRGILSGALDMDKLDYLPRDARACNVPYGGVDTSRLIDSLTVVTPEFDPDRSRKLVGITHKGVSPLHSLITARQEMFDNVYWHHTNRACMAMLLRAIQDALSAGMVSPQQLQSPDDRTLLNLLSNETMPSSTRHLAESLQSRRLHKRAVEISFRATDLYQRLSSLFSTPAARRVIEVRMTEALANATNREIDSAAILIDIPKPEKWRTDVWVSFTRPPVGASSLMTWNDVVGLNDDDFKRYEEHRRLIRIVTIEPLREVVADRWEQLLFPSLGAAL